MPAMRSARRTSRSIAGVYAGNVAHFAFARSCGRQRQEPPERILARMKKLWTLTSLAISDAARAESLVADLAYRQWLRSDTEAALQVFQVAQPLEIEHEVTLRRAIRHQRLLLGGEEA